MKYACDTSISKFIKKFHHNKLKKGTMLEALCSFYTWCENEFCTIQTSGSKVPIKLNLAQRIILCTMMEMAEENKPIKLVIGKARRTGASTLIQLLFVFLCAHYENHFAATLAHEETDTKNLFNIARTCAKDYSKRTIQVNNKTIKLCEADVGVQQIVFKNTNSSYQCRTAGGKSALTGGAISFLHFSEVALWRGDAAETEYSAPETLNRDPFTILIYESTFRGEDALFHKKFKQAQNPGSPFRAVFIPWYLDEKCTHKTKSTLVMDDYETGLVHRAKAEFNFDISHDNLFWRRNKILEITGGEDIFRQEYPSDPHEAVRASQGLIFPAYSTCIIDELPIDMNKMDRRCLFGGIDAGYSSTDAYVILFAAYYNNILYIYDMYHATGKTASDHIKHIKTNHTYYFDPVALGAKNELIAALSNRKMDKVVITCPIRKKEPGDKDFETQELLLISNLIKDNKLKILSTTCKQLILELANYFWNEKTGKPDDKRTNQVFHFDSIDALKYLVMGISRNNSSSFIESRPRVRNKKFNY